MGRPDWVKELKTYAEKDAFRAFLQLSNSIIPYGLIVYSMYFIVNRGYSYLFLIPLYFIAAGFYVRIFIIFHDCAHLSFVKSKTATRIIGYICGVLTFTPYDEWRRTHMIHHGTVGNIDKRGVGDVWTMTAQEYKNSPRKKKLLYRLFRNPLILFIFSPIVLFVIINRIPTKNLHSKEVASIMVTNALILTIILTVALTVGIKYYLIIQLPIVFLSTSFGLWLFFVQHQFQDVYWSRSDDWDIYKAAMEGSSFYNLPPVLRWFTGNIGFHHIHHLNPSIPNYHLKECQNEIEELHEIKPLTFFNSLKSLRLKLYDENLKKMISFREMKKLNMDI